jgi:hypothetical protein
MGGFGSGRKFGADCTDDYRSIDVRSWQRDGYLVPGQYLNWQWSINGEKVAAISVKVETGQLRLIYSFRRNGDDWESLNYPVRLQTTSCNYGGVRYWFTCPVAGCGRRVALLYLGGKIFACRHCYRLAYKSQRESMDDRAHKRANKIRDKLNWPRGILNPTGDKPKGMHWTTYCRLLSMHNEYSNQIWLGTAKKLRIMSERLEALHNK